MPVVVHPEEYDQWLDTGTPLETVKGLLRSYPSELMECEPAQRHERSGVSPVLWLLFGGGAVLVVVVLGCGLGMAQWFRYNAREDARVEALLRAEAEARAVETAQLQSNPIPVNLSAVKVREA